MISILNTRIFFSQIVSLKRKFYNKELLYLSYFFKVTRIEPVSVIIKNNYLLFLVKNEDYFNAKENLNRLRKRLKNFKVLVIREEPTFLRLIFSFFPDTYIHDINLERENFSKNIIITLSFIFDKDRGIAVGNNGIYINTINFIFNNSVNFQINNKYKIKIQCKRVFL
jgi:hypothetical protein